jgi:hypothetical protein
MASTFSNLKFELIGSGEQSNTWGNTTNTNIGTAIEQAITGLSNPIFTSDANLTIDLTDLLGPAPQVPRALVLNVTSTGALTATRNLVVPTIQKQYIVQNNTSGGQSILVKTAAGTGITVPNGAKMHLYVNGVNVIDAVSHFSSLTLGAALPAASGGTGVTTATGTGNNVLSDSPTLVTPNLGTPSTLVGTNITGTAAGLTAGTVTTNANLTGMVTSVGNAASLGSFTSANLAAALTDETGSGAAVFATSPTLVTPNLGTPASGTLTNATGLPIDGGTTGILPVARGGSGTATPSLVQGSNVTITGIWPNQTINATVSGAGTVTSVGGTGTVNGISLSGTVTSSGNLTLGGALSGVSLTTQVTGTLPVANGGTGTATPSLVAGTGIAITGTFPNQTVSASGSSSGDVTGPASSTTNGIVLFNSTTGKVIRDAAAQDGFIHGLRVGRGGGSLSDNTAVGSSALNANTTGTSNTAVGQNSLLQNSDGTNNTGVGRNTLFALLSGNSNTALGAFCLQNTTSNNNTAVGSICLASLTTGSANTAVGNNALANSSTASDNTAIGQGSMAGNTTGSNNTALGRDALSFNATGADNVAVGKNALLLTTAGTNTAVGAAALSTTTTGTNNTGIGNGANAAAAGTSNSITLGNSSINSLRCQVTTITALSDARDKTNIVDIPAGLSFVQALRPVSFDWNMRDGAKVGVREFGFIAQELQKAQEVTGITVPHLVLEENPEKLEASSGTLLPILVKAIQELKAEFDAYKLSHP